jgi:hypothetical protein
MASMLSVGKHAQLRGSLQWIGGGHRNYLSLKGSAGVGSHATFSLQQTGGTSINTLNNGNVCEVPALCTISERGTAHTTEDLVIELNKLSQGNGTFRACRPVALATDAGDSTGAVKLIDLWGTIDLREDIEEATGSFSHTILGASSSEEVSLLHSSLN